MEKSSGDWYMFIDADEILQDCSDIIHFFKSGEYLKYNTASYIVRSYENLSNMELYSDFRALRLTRRIKGVAFVNPVHEALTPAYKPLKYLSLIADHYGYLFRDNDTATEQAREKSKRNLELLLSQLNNLEEGETPEFSLYREIADCYQIIDEPEKALEYVDLGLAVLDHANIAINAYYCQKAIIMVNAKRFEEAIKVCDEYFSKDNVSRKGVIATDITMHVIRGDSYFRFRKYDEAIADLTAFFDKYKKYVNNRLNTNDLLYAPLKLKKSNIKAAFEIFFVSCNMTHKFNTALEYVKAFPIDDFQKDHAYIFKHLCYRIKLMENTSYDGILGLYDQLDDHNKAQFIRITRWYIFRSAKHEEILDNLSAIAGKDPKISAVVDIYRDFFLNNTADSKKIEQFLSQYGSDQNADILCIMLSVNMDITPFITTFDFRVVACIHNFFEDYTDCLPQLAAYDISKISAEGLSKAAGVYARAMVESQAQHRDISGFFRIYGNIGGRWLSESGTVESADNDCEALSQLNGPKVFFGGSIEVFDNGVLTLGNGYINTGGSIACAKSITLGNGVFIGRNTYITDSDHHRIVDSRNEVINEPQAVNIGDHVLIGFGAVILKGVTIGSGAVIAAGAVVTHDIPAGCMAAGVPAKVIRKDVIWK